MRAQPKRLIIIGFMLVLVGMAVPFSILLGFLKSTIALNFLGYGLSVIGLLLGTLGAALIMERNRDRDQNHRF